MIKRDISYIFKRIIIGIGIILGISFIRSCNVYALDDKWYELGYNSSQVSNQCINNNQQIDYVIDGNLYRLKNTNGSIYLNDTYITNLTFCPGYIIGKDTSDKVVVYFAVDSNSYNYYFATYYSNWGSVPNFSDFPFLINNLVRSSSAKKLVYNNGLLESNTNVSCTNINIHNSIGSMCFNNQDFYVYGTNLLRFYYNNPLGENTKYFYSKYGNPVITPNDPEIVSLNPVLNKTDDNMLVSVSFSPEFSYIDTENYNYYAWFEGYDKLKLTQNNVKLNTQSNTTFYVEIRDKQDNYITSQTYTVSSIGLIYNGDYDIQFITNEYTDSDTTNNSDLLIDSINRIDIDITYIPKWINYTYQYQYVESGNSLTNNWITVNNNNADNNVVVSVYSNGKMYARILDSNNNVLKSSEYEITRIGELKNYDNNSNKIFSMFNKINNDINFGGPVSNLITIPVNVIETILQAGSNMCTPYYLGTINGHSLSLTCINPEDYLGSALWSTIDIIVSGCMIYSIFKWLTSLYWSFVILSDIPDIDANKFGDRRDLN